VAAGALRAWHPDAVYVPDHFRPTEDDVRDLLANLDAADLIVPTDEGLLATFLPLIFEPSDASPDAGPNGRLMGHVARNNLQWKTPPTGEALVIVRGPEAYISPAWYPTKREHGRVVPTWNYITAHIHGRFVVHDDRDWIERNVRALVERHEGRRPAPWSVDDAPVEYIEGQLRAIVGVEVVIGRVEAKVKLSQNRSKADVEGAIDGLDSVGDPRSLATAAAMRSAEDRRGR
jgi:transcriptional regulator